eukprot:TRINITY_DN13262_c0_g1_i1.p1 TRINITY_DN13262_c0_g1~~TRINITY_DN13262_c0_g1_i1.p1  ORF type:complete len:942 (-),score=203.59 TRINITY_DN13262_c0_g1_i1:119-2944(-)
MRLKHTIFLAVVLPLLIGVGLILGLTTYFIVSVSPDWVDLVKDKMFENEKTSLRHLSKERASLTDSYLRTFEAQSYVVQEFVGRLYHNGTENEFKSPILPHYHTMVTTPNPPGWEYDADHERYISKKVSGWFQPEALSAAALDEESLSLRNRATTYFMVMADVFLSDNGITNLYMGFEHDGFFHTYPFRDMSSYDNFYTICEGGKDRGKMMQWYDPRCRPWYDTGVNVTDPLATKITVTTPYLSSSGLGLLVASGQPIYNGTGDRTSNDLVGVIAVELPLDALRDAITATKIMKNGYTYLLDRRDDRAVFHKNWPRTKGPESIYVVEFDSYSSSDAIDFRSQYMQSIQLAESGSGKFDKDSEEYYMHYSPCSEQNFTIVAVVPMKDVNEKADDFEDDVSNLVIVEIVVLSVVIVAVVAVSILIVFFLSRRISKPLERFSDHLERMGKGDFSHEIRNGGSSTSGDDAIMPKEIEELFDTFQGLTVALRLGNEVYYRGDLELALSNYTMAMGLFKKHKNTKGVGVCLNNIGNIHFQRKKFSLAKEFFQYAIDNIENECLEFVHFVDRDGAASEGAMCTEARLLDASTVLTENQTKKLNILSGRYSNLALVLVELGEIENAEMLLLKAISLDVLTDSIRGMATRVGNIGEIYRRSRNLHKAVEACENAYRAASTSGDSIAMQYSCINMGKLEKDLGKYDTSLKWFQAALENGPFLPAAVHLTCLKNIAELFEKLGKDDSIQFRKVKELLIGFSKSYVPKNVYFVMDMSGSMAGSRSTHAMRNLKEIYETLLGPQDYVGLITFNHRVMPQFGLMAKDVNDAFIRSHLDNLGFPSGMTAFYDSVDLALEKLHTHTMSSDCWIVALTDGEDNASKITSSTLIGKVRDSGSNLIVVSLGSLGTKSDLKKLAKATPKGLFIEQVGDMSMQDWGSTVTRHITGQLAVESY